MPTKQHNSPARPRALAEPSRAEMKSPAQAKVKPPNRCPLVAPLKLVPKGLAHVIVFLSTALLIENYLLPIKMVHSNSVDYCYSDIGCFPLTDEFYHPRHRPFNVRPWHRRHIGTEFELFSVHFPDGIVIKPWDRLSLVAAQFDPKLETKVIVPGWLDNVDRAVWVKQLRDALLYLWHPVNLIIVRWRNFTPYTVATANTRVVGAELANLIRFIEHELAYDRAYYHLIGHSLGAHISAYAGDRVPGLGRITALDPARPFFQGMPKSVRLDRGDAKFVDAIHSDFTPENAIFLLMSFGMTTPVGHVDFYPNGPPLLQPGCLRDTLGAVQRGILRGLQYSSFQVTFVEALRYLTACDHQRSHEWFIESITNRECVFVGVRCSDYEGMINGRCTCDDSQSACAIMGIHADQMYLSNAHEDLWPLAAKQRARAKQTHQQHKRPPPPPLPLPPIDHYELPPLAYPQPPPLVISPAPVHSAFMDADYPDVPTTAQQPTREAVLAQLREELSHMRRPDEPAPPNDYLMSMMIEPSNVVSQTVAEGQPMDEQQQQALDAELVERLRLHQEQQQLDQEQAQMYHDTLNDMAFIQYLRATILDASQPDAGGEAATNQSYNADSAPGQTRDPLALTKVAPDESNNLVEYDAEEKQQSNSTTVSNNNRRLDFHDEQLLAPHVNGHPRLMSHFERDVEDWYEESSRWYLKTNNRPDYCSNQYQVLVFVGPLKSRQGRGERLRANLIISIIGSRGQLLNQRFVPRSASLDSFTMQPFFILLEGSYSLGQIRSVAIAWEQRHDPDPIKATISFQNNKLANVNMKVPAFKAKHPLLSETLKYDRSHSFQHNHLSGAYASRRQSPDDPEAGKQKGKSKKKRSKTKTKKKQANMSSSFGRRIGVPSADESPRQTTEECQRASTITSRLQSKQTCSSDKLTKRSQVLLDFPDDYEAYEPPNEEPTFLDQTIGLPASVATGLMLDASMLVPAPLLSMASGDLAGAMRPTSPQDDRESQFFEPIVDPIDPALLVDKVKAVQDDGQMSIELHNLHHFQQHAAAQAAAHDEADDNEDSIIINQVVVSPLQATYGQTGVPNAKAFCSPRRGLRLRRDQTVRLRPSLTSRCYEDQVVNV